jgi:hypothetical protein
MWNGTLRSMPVGARLPGVGILLACASIFGCVAFTARTNARIPRELSRAEFARVGADDSSALQGSDSKNQSAMNTLTRLVRDQVLADGNFLGKTRFSIDQKGHTLFYDLNPVPTNLVLAEGDPYADALEELIRVESLRRDFRATIPNEMFWVAALESIDQIIGRCVRDIEALEPKGRAVTNQQSCSDNVHKAFDELSATIITYAKEHGLEIVEPARTRDPSPGYRVQIKIEPPRARVRVMMLLAYKKCQYFKTSNQQCPWNDLLDSESDMIGWYHYRAEWPPELGGTEEGDFEIKKPGTVTFKPPQR